MTEAARPGRTVTRPNGKTYRPRTRWRHRYRTWDNDPEDGRGVITLFAHGTDDNTEHAITHAIHVAAYHFGDLDTHTLTNPQPGWWRNAYDRRGERAWIRDDVRGAPGIMLTWTERPR